MLLSFRRFEISEFQALNQHISTLKSAQKIISPPARAHCRSSPALGRGVAAPPGSSVHGALELLGALEAELSEVIGKTYGKNGSNDSN
jgi:hypothetical protein